MAPKRPDIEPFGVFLALLGNKPNWAVGCEDMDDAERDGRPVGEATDAPDTEE
jgi:hypothetical protein|tara:strand:+ start:39291 stop:39449 length:159 start_codon:yes stop_codon:yes gene_type:complete